MAAHQSRQTHITKVIFHFLPDPPFSSMLANYCVEKVYSMVANYCVEKVYSIT